jgi:hypothetical protein
MQAFVRRNLYEVLATIAVSVVGFVATLVLTGQLPASTIVGLLTGGVSAIFRIARSEAAWHAGMRAQLDAEADERAAAGKAARDLRELLFETELITDVEELQAKATAEWANPGKTFPRTSWTAAAIIERGADGLEKARLNALADAIRSHVDHAAGVVDDGALDRDAQKAREHVLEVGREAATEMRFAATTRAELHDKGPLAPPEERRRLEDAFRDGRYGAVSALKWLEGTIEQLERLSQPLPDE